MCSGVMELDVELWMAELIHVLQSETLPASRHSPKDILTGPVLETSSYLSFLSRSDASGRKRDLESPITCNLDYVLSSPLISSYPLPSHNVKRNSSLPGVILLIRRPTPIFLSSYVLTPQAANVIPKIR